MIECFPLMSHKDDLCDVEGIILVASFSDILNRNRMFVRFWFDSVEYNNMWLYFNVSKSDFDSYISNQITARQLWNRAQQIIEEITDAQNFAQIAFRTISLDEIEQKFWPSEDSFFSTAQQNL